MLTALGGLGTNDPYQFGARVTGQVGRAWIAEVADRAAAGRASCDDARGIGCE